MSARLNPARHGLDQHDGLADDRLAAADRPDVLAGLGLDVHGRLVDAEQPRQVRPDRRLVRAELGLLGVDDRRRS